jgi:UDP-GlcNAc:undecaprenyl-phosphate GlcNAc-1-phosphate transferase
LLTTLLAGISAYAFTLLTTPWVRQFALRVGCVSHPAHDRWGRRVVSRLGGVPIALALLAAAGIGALQDSRLWGLFAAGVLMLATGLTDDFKNIHPNSKLIAQILAGCAVLLSGIHVNTPLLPWLMIPLTIGWLVLVMNAFNLMDNMDGLSGGIGAIAGAFLTWHILKTNNPGLALAAAALTGATIGFLRYNLPPAKIFMGDSGSQLLGLGLGTLSLMGTWQHSARLLGILALPTLLLAVPIFDTLFVTFQRMLHGRHPFQGGTDHLSHRLGVLGLTPRQVIFTLYALTALFGFLGVLFTGERESLAITGIWLLAAAVLLMLGATLAKVRVYAGPSDSSPPPDAKVTVVETMLVHKRRIVEVAVDFCSIWACYVMAHALRFEAALTPDLEQLIFQSFECYHKI